MLLPIAHAYGRRVKEFGPNPKGVYWKNEDGQTLRFEVMAGVLPVTAETLDITVNDLGCGYGAFYGFLAAMAGVRVSAYYGYDMSAEMIAEARIQTRPGGPHIHFIEGSQASQRADYSFASGTYNMLLNEDPGRWRGYILESLKGLWDKTARGLAFNMLKADAEHVEGGLFRTPPDAYVDFCRTLSDDVTLVEDYPLDEWTVLVRR